MFQAIHFLKLISLFFSNGQAFIQALLSTYLFPQRIGFFTVSLVHYLREVSTWWAPKENLLKFRSPEGRKMHFRHSFWLQKHSLNIIDKHFFPRISVENTSILPCLFIFYVWSGSNFVKIYNINILNVFKVKNRNTKIVSMTSFWYLYC